MKKVMLSAAVCAMAFSANADVASEVEVIEAVQTSAFSSIYAGLGIGGSFLKCGDLKANRFIGSFVLGGGKVFSNNVYAGAEFLMDFTKNKKWDGEADGSFAGYNFNAKVNLKSGGFIPQINAKIGYVFRNDVLAYAKLGCAWTKVSVDGTVSVQKSGVAVTESASASKTKASFVLGLGVEKAFCKKFSAAVEGDYNFGWKEGGHRWNKGWSVRALVKYNVKY
ncbi:MAG: outer membrane beta-barrel protein [Alphaproteobacteria bacterium]|nr:outer membrane beta-barrel protein [Alphaproteobacteria bacterium]